MVHTGLLVRLAVRAGLETDGAEFLEAGVEPGERGGWALVTQSV
jgi:hypothetical protein